MQSDNQNSIKVKHYHIQIDAMKFTCQQYIPNLLCAHIDCLVLMDTFDVVNIPQNHIKNQK